MKTFLSTLVLLFSITAFSQTELIAFKSHSGNMNYFKLSGFDNLGEPPMYIDSIIKLNDSTIVEYLSWGLNDTIVNHPVCNMPQASLDSLKGTYYNYSMRFINFEPIPEFKTDTVQTDSIIKAIEDFGIETEEEKLDLIPVSEENITPPVSPQTSSAIVVPASKLNVLWYGLFGFVFIMIATLWLKMKPKLQV